MKKLIALLMMLCLLPLSALAEMDEDGDVVVTLDGAEFFFTPLEDCYILLRDTSASVFNRLGFPSGKCCPTWSRWGSTPSCMTRTSPARSMLPPTKRWRRILMS